MRLRCNIKNVLHWEIHTMLLDEEILRYKFRLAEAFVDMKILVIQKFNTKYHD